MATLTSRAAAGQTRVSVPNTPTAVTVNGTATTAYTFFAGLVTFNSALSQGDLITVTYTDPVVASPGGGGGSGVTYSNFVGSGSANAAGLVPAPGSVAGTAKFLREDGGWSVPAYTSYSVFGPSGTGASNGLVPSPGTTAGTTRFLREDGTWVVPTIKNNFAATVAPTATDDATAGYVAGSSWMNSNTGDMWRCRSATAGAARWVKMDVADHPGYVVSKFYTLFGVGAPIAGSNLPLGSIYMHFGVVKQRITISQLQAKVTTVSAGGNFQLGIYNHDPASGKASTLVATTVAGSTGTTTNVNLAINGGSVTLEPGNYWFAVMCDNATAVFLAVGPSSFNHLSAVGTSTGFGTNATTQPCGVSVTATYGTWASDITSAAQNEILVSRAPIVMFQVASVP